MDKENNLELLKAQIGNLEVQVSEYQQIVKELTEKLLTELFSWLINTTSSSSDRALCIDLMQTCDRATAMYFPSRNCVKSHAFGFATGCK